MAKAIRERVLGWRQTMQLEGELAGSCDPAEHVYFSNETGGYYEK